MAEYLCLKRGDEDSALNSVQKLYMVYSPFTRDWSVQRELAREGWEPGSRDWLLTARLTADCQAD